MSPELEDRLFGKYPDLFAGRNEPITQNLMAFGCECGDGWYHLIDTFCGLVVNDIKYNKMPPVKFMQIKEKYGTLRLYTEGGDQRTGAYETAIEGVSAKTCEVCGAPGKIRDGGWIVTRCDEHA